MSTPLRIGTLGAARITPQALVKPARKLEGVEVVAIAARDPAKAAKFARRHGISQVHDTYEDLIRDPEIDAIYNPLPNSLHAPWTLEAIAAGKHVLCEKPYSRHPAEVVEAFDLAERSGLVLMEAFMYRHHPQTRIVADLIRSGEIGRPRLIQASFSFVLDSLDDVRAKPELDGGSLMDVGCYCISGTRLVAGEPSEVVGEQITGPTGIDMSFRGALHFEDGAVGQFACSFEAPRRQELRVIGEQGTLSVEAPWRVDWGGDVLLQRGDDVTRVDVPGADSYQRQLDNLADAASGKAPPLLGREDALGQARVVDALHRSATKGQAVSVAGS